MSVQYMSFSAHADAKGDCKRMPGNTMFSSFLIRLSFSLLYVLIRFSYPRLVKKNRYSFFLLKAGFRIRIHLIRIWIQ
jgi:hypothetical protein